MPLSQLQAREGRIRGGLFGLLIGDALGDPYEFHRPEELPPASEIEYEPPAGFANAGRGSGEKPRSGTGGSGSEVEEEAGGSGR